MKRVLLVCSGGMSSAIVVKAIENEAKKENFAMELKAIGTTTYEEEMAQNWDVVLVAPQVRHRIDTFKKVAEEFNVPIGLISPQGYSPLGGAKAFAQVKDLLK